MTQTLPRRLKIAVESLLARVPPVAGSARRVIVLCYHSVHPSGDFPSTTRPAAFEEHLGWLGERCEVVPFRDVLQASRATTDGRPAVSVTFDDAFADNYTYAMPLLKRFSVPATFFVTTGLVERDRDVIGARSWRGWRDKGSTLTWDQIREMQAAGMEIGAHGHTHRTLAQLDDAVTESDLRISKEILEDRLGTAIRSLAYPKGRPRRDFTESTMKVARGIGYERAGAVLFRGVRPSDPLMSIPRFPVEDDTLDILDAKISGRLDLIGGWQEHAPLWLLRALGR